MKYFQLKGNIKLLMFLLSLVCSLPMYAQSRVITGRVLDGADQSPIPGVNVLVKGTTIGTVTDFDGNYKLSTDETVTELVFTYVGYKDLVQSVGLSDVVDISLEPDLEQLEEVVVVGYGVEKKKLNTGATLNVKGEDLQKLNTATAMDGLQGITPGVNITKSNGSPGAGTKVVIRGTGTIGNSNPLYIVDGTAVGDIDYLSPADIETIDVLKDAASSAIYGSRAANGVILVTTKKGTKGPKPTISYDMYYGVQQVAKAPDLLNAQEYIMIMNEKNANGGNAPIDWSKQVTNFNDYALGINKGTNWFEETYNKNAPVQNHSINMTGGSAESTYSIGFNYFDQEGIIGKQINSSFTRVNVRMNTDHVLIKNNVDRNILKFGQTLNYTNSSKPNIASGNRYYNDLHNMLVASPLLPMYAPDRTHKAYPYHDPQIFDQGANPIAIMEAERKDIENKNHQVVGSAYFEVEPIENLKIKSQFGINASYGSSRTYVPSYNYGIHNQRALDGVKQTMYSNSQWTWTNTATYSKKLGKHNLTGLLGQEMIKQTEELKLEGENYNTIFQDPKFGYLSNAVNTKGSADGIIKGGDSYGWGLMSYFGRVSYNYNETFMLTAVLRADGSSNFLADNRWGYFPSFSAGYILTSHDFMESVPQVSYFKIRGGWGQNGNQDIRRYQYAATIGFENNGYPFNDPTQNQPGGVPVRIPNPNVTWETSEQANIGFDANLFDDKLQITADIYQKNTKDWLVIPPAPAYYGTTNSFQNGGEIVNKGYEISISWNERKENFSYGATFSFAHNTNEVIDIRNEEKLLSGPANVLSNGTEPMFRAEVGYPLGYFYGFETAGVLQNAEEAAAYVGPNGDPYFNNQQAGDVRFVDQNNDGKIDADDRTMIGNPIPSYTLGLQLNAEYKGIYTSIVFTSQLGHQVIRSWRSFSDQPKQNYTTDVFERWQGEGTSTTKPRLAEAGHQNEWVSDLYVEDADFLRVSNITLGYNFSRLAKSPNSPLKNLRVYYTGLNLFTFTQYSGMDPEIGYSPEDQNGDTFSSGIDVGLYPASKTHMLGLSFKF
ncbi:SusC/RagA family TonB-linked outer membrane protein [Flammeovirga kamogawensis]|uniref:TonB-dependent receptor n=1 Tax=Flammeovirga kamogawensis TaxID=373891 RepID=A0ABX8H4C7_9BACT|nr:TonB-dependent receptor [Flammeovirga kamogawensis]MBB6460385.1 TonB-linked SusC/RagA family outer membrane protein [Flammeovirga kamogawensis]QWG10192.1 TonB-dependent receptor [Flammeovirga kamogawensis]